MSKGRIDIYKPIGSSWFQDGIEAESFVQDLKKLEAEFDEIDIHINSPGGSVFDGLPIYNAIVGSAKTINIYIDGIAASMAAVIAMAGKHVSIAKNGLLMFHSASGVSFGNKNTMLEAAELLGKIDDVLAVSIADKTGDSKEDISSKYFDGKNHWLTAEESKEAGLVDEVLDLRGKNVPKDVTNMSYEDLMATYNRKEGFVDQVREAASLFAEEVKNLFKKEEEKEVVNENLNKDVIMENLEKFQNILGLEAESSVEDVIAAIEGLKSGQAEAEGKIEALNAKVTEKEADVEAKDGEIAELKATVAELTAKIPATPLDNKGDDFEGKENLGDIPLFG